ncbi:hypothetical protein LSAT2_025549 [Lamellibrachia satsuma]|nr:hypothetical protein LSAT2_025549 [Lamellibrachia satsuma]
MTVQNVPRIAELSPGDVSDPGDRRYMDGIADRSGRFPRTVSQPSRDSNVRPRDGSGAVQSTLPEHQLRTRFRHVYASRRYAASGRLVVQPGGNRVFSCVTSRYRTDLLRRLKEARSIDSFDQGGSPDARRPGDWLSGHGLLLRTDHTSHSSTVGSRRNIEQSAVKGVQRDIHSLTLESGHRADPTSGVNRHSVEYAKAVNGQQDLPRHDAPSPAAGANTTPYTRTVSAAAAETVCSCPTACRGHDVEHVDRPHTGRSHPARLRMKLSSRLSHEAQCAINETRREMGVSLVGSDSVSDDKPKETSACTDSVRPHPSSEHIPDVTLRAENATNQHYCFTSTPAQTKDPIYKTRLCKQPECYSTSPGRSHDTGNTHAGTHATRQHGGMPALTSLAVDGVMPSLNVFTSSPATYNNTDRGARLVSLSQCYRTVPLLRKAREKTFEITPPWYDSRYTDDPTRLPLCTPVEPPKDIKSHAVEKCLGWLNKYL